MCPVRDSFCDLIEVQPHCLRVDVRHNQPCGGTTGGTKGTEDIALLVTHITRCAGAGSAPRPFARKCSLLPNTGFILEPYLKGLTLCMFWHELDYEAGKVFLKAYCVAGSVLGYSVRTERRRNPCLARYLPIVRSCKFTPNMSSKRACKSAQCHRTMPSLTGLAQLQPTPQNAPIVLATGATSCPCHVGQKAQQCRRSCSDAPSLAEFGDPCRYCEPTSRDPRP